jgi:NADPH:quinone reductase-like Zn-dependent oxidoreductase
MVVEDVPVPAIIMLDEVLVQVKAASVDLVDIKICSGYGKVLRKQLNRYNNVSSDCM